MSSVSTAFKVHYNQKLGDPFGHLGEERTMAFGGIDAPVDNGCDGQKDGQTDSQNCL